MKPKQCLAEGSIVDFEHAVWRRIVQLTTGYYDREKRHYVDKAPPKKPPRTGRRVEYEWRLKSIQVWVRDNYLEGIRRDDEELESVREVFGYLKTKDDGWANLRTFYREKGTSNAMKLRMRRAAWNYPALFSVTSNNRTKEDRLECSDEGMQVFNDEQTFWENPDEEGSVKVLKKIVMMTRERRLPLSKLRAIQKYYHFPWDIEGFVGRHPYDFRVVGGKDLELVSWDESLTVTEREKAVAEGRNPKGSGPHAFVISYPLGYIPNRVRVQELEAFQKVEFPSPYEIATEAARDFRLPCAQKRILAIYHELLSFTLEKRALVRDLAPLAKELELPGRYPQALLDCHPGIFYVSHWQNDFCIFLRDAYHGKELVKKTPLEDIRQRYLRLMVLSPTTLYEKSRFIPKGERRTLSNRDFLEKGMNNRLVEDDGTYCTRMV